MLLKAAMPYNFSSSEYLSPIRGERIELSMNSPLERVQFRGFFGPVFYMDRPWLLYAFKLACKTNSNTMYTEDMDEFDMFYGCRVKLSAIFASNKINGGHVEGHGP